jgi:hypothetical protein
MADQEHFFENDGTDWWLRDETYVYATAGSSTRTLVGVTRQRLTGFPANRLAETKTTDADGNITTRTVDVARSSKTLTNTTASSGQTQTQTETVVDGLSLSLVTFQNLTITTGYDGLQNDHQLQIGHHTVFISRHPGFLYDHVVRLRQPRPDPMVRGP